MPMKVRFKDGSTRNVIDVIKDVLKKPIERVIKEGTTKRINQVF